MKPVQVAILIVDGITTGRVALKVKLAAAWYDVSTAATGAEALAAISKSRPSLVIVRDSLPDMPVSGLVAALAHTAERSPPPVIALAEAGERRSPLLEAGVEDVLSLPLDDRLLIARIRSVLRAHAAAAEWRLRDGTCRALGFAEPAQNFDTAFPALLLADERSPARSKIADLADTSEALQLSMCRVADVLRDDATAANAEVLLLPLSPLEPERELTLLADLRAHPTTRHKALFVLSPPGRADVAAQALDLGADDVAILGGRGEGPGITGRELTLRTKRLHARNKMSHSLRTIVRNGAEAALRDPLTGLHNRRYALPHLQRIAEQAQATSRPFSVMVADLDYFKKINDVYGHKAGDTVLAECARRLKQNMRAVDLVARIGGEEFLVVMPGTGRVAARKAALRLCEKIAEKPFSLPGSATQITATISIGLAVSAAQADLFDQNPKLMDTDPNALIDRADRALYAAKERGRNRFIQDQAAA